MKKTMEQKKQNNGFTLVELIVVVLILSIAALVAIPVFSSAADIQVRSAANRIAADLDYARGLAITRQKNYAVVFDAGSECYDIREAGGDVITNPLDNTNFVVDLDADSRLGNVNIVSAVFEGVESAVTFDYLGTPYAGNDAALTTRLNSEGVITLRSANGGFVLHVNVEPMTGNVEIE